MVTHIIHYYLPTCTPRKIQVLVVGATLVEADEASGGVCPTTCFRKGGVDVAL